MKKRWQTLAVTAIAVTIAATVFAAQKPLSISADELQYDANTNLVKVAGHVVIDQGTTHITGENGWYKTNTQEAFLAGGVKLIGDNVVGHANQMHLLGQDHIIATGNAYFKQGEQILEGDNINYNSETGYGVINGNGFVKNAEYSIAAPHIEAWTKKIYAVGTGGVKITSYTQKIYGTGDKVEYTQTPNKKDGVAYIRGNAYVEQDGNTFHGKTLKVFMATNSVETEGRSTLVIQQK